MKNILIVVAMLLVFNVLFVFGGGLDKLRGTKDNHVVAEKKVPANVVDVFRFTLEDEVKKKIGTPIEGFEPQMFLDAFPGLVETDFEGVQASSGNYSIVNGRLVHQMDSSKLVHSAAGAITRNGMETLLNNVAKRAGIDLKTDGTITDVIHVLTQE